MSWIQENKFAATVIGATVVLSGALFYLGMDARSSADEARIKGDAAISTANSLRNKKPYPNSDNRALVRTKVAKFIGDSEAFQKDLLDYRPKTLPRPSPKDFSNAVSSHISSLKTYYKDKEVGLPNKGQAAFGLEKYSGAGMVQTSAARYLDYQRKALFFLFKSLADTEPVSLDNVYRAPLPEEVRGYEPDKKKNSRQKSKVTSVYRSMPIELRFTGTEKSLKAFLQTLANTKEYFFITRSVTVKNLKDESPNLSDGLFEEKAPNTGGFEGFEGIELEGGDQGGDSAFANNDPILKQVLGGEKITAHLKIDLILFKEAKNVTFPAASRSASKNN